MIKIYAWPNYNWWYEEDIQDIDLFMFDMGISDDFMTIELPENFPQEEISDFVEYAVDNKINEYFKGKTQ